MDGQIPLTGEQSWRTRLSREAVAEIRSHANFPLAMRISTAAALALSDSDHIIDGGFKDMGRYRSALFALHLHATGGLTLARLRVACAESGVLGRGRAREMLEGLRRLGYVAPLPHTGDARERPYGPCPDMAAAVRRRLDADLAGAELLSAEAARARKRLGEPAVFAGFVATAGVGLLKAMRSNRETSAIMSLFSDRVAGMLILCHLIGAGAADDDIPPTGPIRLSLAGLAKRFGVSRTHILRLVRDAEARGLLDRDARTGDVRLRPAFRQQIVFDFAASFLLIIHAARNGLANARAAA